MNQQILILFGATGDLAQHRLLPALYAISCHEGGSALPHILALGRRPYSTEEFLEGVKTHLPDDSHWEEFAARIHYLQLDFNQESEYQKLVDYLGALDAEHLRNQNFYLSVPPAQYQTILTHIAHFGLHEQQEGRVRRLIVEKPFGADLHSAQELDAAILAYFDEEHLYRLDHYIGKETVQNILALRFANGIFEPLWCKEYIDHIQITLAESEGIKTRAAYYDQTGAFRDVVQNHLLQVVSILLMEKPTALTFEALSDAKIEVLNNLTVDLEKVVFGQYADYLEEPGVNPESEIETYAMATLYSDSQRWRGVPLYVRTGKKLPTRIFEISVQFKQPTESLFQGRERITGTNVVTICLQPPDESIFLSLAVKTPRHFMEVEPGLLKFNYSSISPEPLPDSYEQLFLDIFRGDKSLTLREDSIEASWKIIDTILSRKNKPEKYEVGSWGPEKAHQLLASDGREWIVRQPGQDKTNDQ